MIEAAEQTDSSAGLRRVLVVGDDGRLSRLVAAAQAVATYEPRALDGLVRLDGEAFDAVVLHAEPLAGRTGEVVRAVRRLCPSMRVVLYGEAFTEGYCQQGLEAGADDYLIWPIPAAELRQAVHGGNGTLGEGAAGTEAQARPGDRQIGRAEAEAPAGASGRVDVAAGRVLGLYRELAELIPHGREVLIERAQRELAALLGAQWVEIHAGGQAACERTGGRAYELTGPAGPAGTMTVGPAAGRGEIEPAQAAEFLGTLLYLAERDASLKQLATVDELTGAYNRRYLEYFLRQVIELSSQQNTEVTLLIFDIDDFKHYNDTYGHLAGDLILKQATRMMRRCCRGHDVVARMGGDEFAVLFWDTGQGRDGREQGDERRGAGRSQAHPEVAVFLSNRFRRMMKTSDFSVLGPEARGRLAISGGLASFPHDGRTVMELMARADEALLCAKRSGKDCIYLVGQP